MRSGDAAKVRLDEARPAAGVDGVTAATAAHPSTRAKPAAAYPVKQPFTWWTRRRGYLLYMLREFTAVGIAAWMILFLVEIARARQGAPGYQPLGGPLFIAVGVVCLALALWHSYTFLSLAGVIMRIPLGDRTVSPRLIVGVMYGGLVAVTAVIAGLLIWGGA
jgi:succinate dehydrogenase subunit C